MSIIDLYDLFIHNPQITTDSRNCPKGSIFFALKGDKFDGNQYAGKALASGWCLCRHRQSRLLYR